ncbi:MAG: glucose-6-phosphate isomerase [Francisellaceae bacterium]|mgnify:CR=1 FL=1|jgi:glucose-6-phosphate isomerase|nr:glucose-6-phosphate isomerase [Francisellaceae bacterium]MBT6539430.1 glucose-6-phosphate isomerase [Francisellaceae bacterium]
MKLESFKSWKALKALAEQIHQESIVNYFENDKSRFSKYSVRSNDYLFDYSKQHINDDCLSTLLELARESGVESRIKDLFSGMRVNRTEDKEAGHSKLRVSEPGPEIIAVLDKMECFINDIYAGRLLNGKHEPITDVIALGIGGSALGPQLVNECLSKYDKKRLNIHYISNVDSSSINSLLNTIPLKNTICIVSSKSFSTIETMTNAATIRQSLNEAIGSDAAMARMFAVTANEAKAQKNGYPKENIFKLWDWVGGRYSLWSAVGLPIALAVGMDNFRELLAGAYDADLHFARTKLNDNIPVLMALIGIWNSNFLNYKTLAVIPYYDGLAKLPNYLQQLEMESNGKCARYDHGPVNYDTCPVVWGGVGCDGQHAYMQMLHQGTQTVPVDFIVPVESSESTQDKIRLASALAQAKALMDGTTLSVNNNLDAAKVCPGNKPSTTFVFNSMTPRNLGRLIAFYEHKVFVQGAIWQIESFDQWGVELGKKLANSLLPVFDESSIPENLDSSTAGLLDYIFSHSS